ncbi:MAG: hypothetical protein Q9181_007227 [Wetmoreana brouardii]
MTEIPVFPSQCYQKPLGLSFSSIKPATLRISMASPEFQYTEKGAQEGSNKSERQALNTKSTCFQAQQQAQNSALEHLSRFQEDKERRRQSVFGSGLGLPRTADELRGEQLLRSLATMSLRDRLTTDAKWPETTGTPKSGAKSDMHYPGRKTFPQPRDAVEGRDEHFKQEPPDPKASKDGDRPHMTERR